MNIGFYFGRKIYSDPRSGGAFTFAQSIFEELIKTKINHNIFIFSDDADKFENTKYIKFVKIERYYSKDSENILKKLILRLPRKILRIIQDRKYKNALNKTVLEYKIDLMWFATSAFEFVDIPYVYTVWDLQHRKQTYFHEVSVNNEFEKRENFYESVISKASFIITGNKIGKAEVCKFYNYPEERVIEISLPTPNFIFKETLANKLSFEKYKPYLFYPAQFWPHKNHIVILLALKILKEKYNLDFNVIFTGSDKGNLNYIKEKTQELNLVEQIKFLGFVSIEELICLYKNAFALVFSTFFGPDNIPPLEAFSLGCPVIASKVDGSEYQLKDASLLFDPKDEFELADKIKELYDDTDLRIKLIERGFEIANSCSAKNYVEKIFKVVDDFERIARCWSSSINYKK